MINFKRVKILQQDGLALLRSLPAESIDCTITDVPYESMEKHRKQGGTTGRLKHSTKSSNDWFRILPNYAIPELLHQIYRVQKKGTHAYLFCDDETSDLMKPAAFDAGFKRVKRLVWNKMAIGMGYRYRAKYEFILYCEKSPNRRLADAGQPDVLDEKRVWNAYPTEKPVALASILVRQSTLPGDLVLDPYMGSGAFGVAAIREGRCFLGNDTSDVAIVRATGDLWREVQRKEVDNG